LALVANHPRSTPDQACSACHAGATHHANQPIDRATECADCHREHRGREALSEVADRYCVQCHADLQTTAGPSHSFVREVSEFEKHPEFALLRQPGLFNEAGPEHYANRVATQTDGVWRDKAQIRLNHHVHLNPAGIPKAPGDKELTHMKCADCHELDPTGRNMAPIRFEKHCASCHADQLRFEIEPANRNTDLTALGTDVPLKHREPAAVRAELRDRLTRLIKEHPELATTNDSQGARAGETRPLLPGEAPRDLSEAAWNWVDRQMGEAEGHLFQDRVDVASSARAVGCAYCHRVEHDGDEVKVTLPAIPSVWLGQGRFAHDSHRMLDCQECHAQAPESTATADILLPKISECQKCHTNRPDIGVTAVSRARNDCVECHNYHGREGKPFDGHLRVDSLRGHK
jgi:predicted CXXCH cytochrome family protein